jgi:hypothetical protein
MTTISKVAAVLGIVTGLAVSALPLASYAATEDVTVSVTVQSTLGSGDAVCGATSGSTATGAAGTNLTATCAFSSSSNNGLKVQIKDADSNLNLVSGSNSIAPITTTGGTTLSASNGYGWGYLQNFSGSNWTSQNNTEEYSKITSSDVLLGQSNEAGPVSGTITFGARTAETQAPGTYTDTVTVTTTAI